MMTKEMREKLPMVNKLIHMVAGTQLILPEASIHSTAIITHQPNNTSTK